jgi:hypothetical protein
MNGETKSGVNTISLGRLQCVRRDSAGPIDRRRSAKVKERVELYLDLRGLL